MRSVFFAAALAFILLIAPVIPWRPLYSSAADTGLAVGCNSTEGVVSEGRILPGEYSESYFDETTKLLAYFSCSDTDGRTLQMAIVSPWEGWVGLLLQASETWNGDMNVVRVSYERGIGPRSYDGYFESASNTERMDVDWGGMTDVYDLTAESNDGVTVYEFAVPLTSDDIFDSHMTGDGFLYFQLAYSGVDVDFKSEASGTSPLNMIQISTQYFPKVWSELQFLPLEGSHERTGTEVLFLLRNDRGFSVPNAMVHVFMKAAFGFAELGVVMTNSQGVARAVLEPRGTGTYLVGAAFEGGQGLLASVVWMTLVLEDTGRALPIVDSGHIALSLVFLGVAGVWLVYAYALVLAHLATARSRGDLRPTRQQELRKWR